MIPKILSLVIILLILHPMVLLFLNGDEELGVVLFIPILLVLPELFGKNYLFINPFRDYDNRRTHIIGLVARALIIMAIVIIWFVGSLIGIGGGYT